MKGFLIIAGIFVVMAVSYPVLTGISNGRAILGHTETVKGRVVSIYPGPSYDVGFILEGDGHIYYVNRGLQYHFKLKELREAYMGKELEISYVSFFDSKGGHINRIRFGDSIVYNELK